MARPRKTKTPKTPQPRATLVFDTDFEPPTTLANLFPGGIVSNTAYTTAYVRTGTQAMYCNGDPCYQQHVLGAPFPAAVYVARFYIYNVGWASGSIEIFNVLPNAGGGLRMGIDAATKKLGWTQGSGISYSFLSASALSLTTWYRIDLRVNVSGTTFTVDWQINGTAQTQASWTGQTATTISSIFFGHPTGNTGWPSVSFDSYSVSGTAADYPLGPPVTGATINSTPSGGIILGGGRSVTRAIAAVATGGVRLGGTASSSRAITAIRVGGVQLSGSVLFKVLGPTNTSPPVVTGSLVQGQVLTCAPGTWVSS